MEFLRVLGFRRLAQKITMSENIFVSKVKTILFTYQKHLEFNLNSNAFINILHVALWR